MGSDKEFASLNEGIPKWTQNSFVAKNGELNDLHKDLDSDDLNVFVSLNDNSRWFA